LSSRFPSGWDLGELGTERIVVSGEARLRVFTERESKEIEKLRRGVSGLIDHLTYPLADRVRWMPLAAKPLFERERARLEKEAKQQLGDLVGGDIAAFVKSRRPRIEQEASEVYAMFHPNERLPSGTINLILRDLEDRLLKATGDNFLPKVSFAMTGPPTGKPATESPGVAGQRGELYEVRWPDGSRFDNRRKVDECQARLLVEAGVCVEKRSPTGILRHLKMKRNPPMKRFASLLAQADFTTTRKGNLQEHIASKRKGL
jgi:hypothetical protein